MSMNRNAEAKFACVPTINAPRSIFDLSHGHTTTCNVGECVPVFCKEVLPGDTWRVKTAKVIRLQTLLAPIFGNLFADFYWFECPNTILWTHWKEFQGENTSSAWVPSVTYTVPTISAPASTGFAVGGVADHLGFPVGISWTNSDEQAPIALPLRAYAKIMDEFFRDQALTAPLNIPLGDSNQTGTNGSSYINDVANGGALFVAAKYHDYFTTCQPSPQRAVQPVTFPLISGTMAPVLAGADHDITVGSAMRWRVTDNTTFTGKHSVFVSDSGTYAQNADSSLSGWKSIEPSNLYADLSTSVGAVTVNQLRLAFQLQRYYERLAYSGSRYTEQLKAFFGLSVPDGLLYRPQYLGGNRVPINVSSVTNTAQTATDFLGDLGAKSETVDVHADFDHSFSQHGWLICIMVVRYEHLYSQGLDRQFKRKTLTQYYNPVFQTLGAQPVFTDELCADASNMATADVFGYQEAWSEYRFAKNEVTGLMRPGVANSLSYWHPGDYYTTPPTLSDAWIREDKTNVDRTLAVTSAVSNQILADIWFDAIATRPLPIYSVPGLIDHH